MSINDNDSPKKTNTLAASENNSEPAPNSVPETIQPTDIDSLEVTVLMLVKNQNQFQSVSSFLNRRGWPTDVLTSLNQAIQYLATKKPDFVLISLNHPSPKISILPNLINQTFSSQVLVFGESADFKTVKALNESNVPNKIMGMVSGPGIHRKIIQMLNEMYNPTANNEAQNQQDGNKQNDVIRFSNDAQKNEYPSLHAITENFNKSKKSKAEKKIDAEALKRLADSFGQKSERSDTDETTNSQNFGKTGAKENKPANGFTSINKNGKPVLWERSDEGSDHGTNQHSNQEAKVKASVEKTKAEFGNVTVNGKLDAQPQGNVGNPLNSRNGTKGYGPLGEPEKNGSGGHSAQLKTNNSNLIKNLQTSAAVNGMRVRENSELNDLLIIEKVELERSHKKSELEKAIVEVLQKNPVETSDDRCKLQIETELRIIPVTSIDCPGYILLAFSKNEIKENEELVFNFYVDLNKVLNDRGIAIEMADPLKIQIQPFDFYHEVQRVSDFAIIQGVGSGEIGISFIPFSSPCPKLAWDAESQMASIIPADISANRPVNFNAYVYLEKNQKYFLYLRKGKKFLSAQKDRFSKNDELLFLNFKDKDDYLQFYIQSQVAKILEELKDSEESKAG